MNPVSPKGNITLKELYEEWSEPKYNRVSKSTADNYRAAWKYYKKLEKAKFKDIRTMHIQEVIDSCHKSGRSRSTMEKVKALIIMLYDYGIQTT